MKSRIIVLAVVSLIFASNIQQAGAQSGRTKIIHGYLASDKAGAKKATAFPADTKAIYAFWKGQALDIGDSIRVVWIAEDVGEGTGAKEAEINSAQARIYKTIDEGSFSLVRPGYKSFPVGKYRVQLYVNADMVEVLKFTIKPSVTIETR